MFKEIARIFFVIIGTAVLTLSIIVFYNAYTVYETPFQEMKVIIKYLRPESKGLFQSYNNNYSEKIKLKVTQKLIIITFKNGTVLPYPREMVDYVIQYNQEEFND